MRFYTWVKNSRKNDVTAGGNTGIDIRLAALCSGMDKSPCVHIAGTEVRDDNNKRKLRIFVEVMRGADVEVIVHNPNK
jgi:hypothetical protein